MGRLAYDGFAQRSQFQDASRRGPTATIVSMRTTTLANELRRRDPGDRIRLYLDQSTTSRLVDDPARAALRELLVEGVRSGRIVCPYSSQHTAESILAEHLYEKLDRLYEELCMGIDFHDDDYIAWAEVHAAAADFAGAPARPMWREAFRVDPDIPRAKLFAGGFRVILNTTKTTKGKAAVRLECSDPSGKAVLSSQPDWPFIEEPGYSLPHTHQPITPQQLKAIARCRLNLISQTLEGELRRKRQ
jgi:hypothetical protein